MFSFFVFPADIRLINPNFDSFEGQIEVLVDGKWGPICGLDMGPHEAQVICKQLGYPLGAKIYYFDAEDQFDTFDYYSNVFYLGLSCNSYEENINQCIYGQLIASTAQCSSSNLYGGVTCDTGLGKTR